MAKVRIQADEIASNGEKTILENIAAYRVTPLLDSMDDEDVICKANLYGVVGDSGTEIYITAGSPWPVILTNGVDFLSTKRVIKVAQVIVSGSTQTTNDGAGIIWRLNYTDNTKTVVDTIEIETVTADGITVEIDTLLSVY